MMRWYRSLIPGRMPLPLAWVVALLGAATLLLWIATTLGSGIVIPLQTGDTIRFEQVRLSADATTAHYFTVTRAGIDGEEGLDIDFNLDDGRFGSDPPGGPLDGYEITFTEPGQYIISDSAHPGTHGSAKFVVTDADRGGRLIVTGALIVDDVRFELRISEAEAQFGYAAGSQVVSRSLADQVIFLSLLVGSALAAPLIAWIKRRRWWLWGLFGLVLGFLGAGQPFLTSATVVGALLLAERPRPEAAVPERELPEEDEEGEEPPDDDGEPMDDDDEPMDDDDEPLDDDDEPPDDDDEPMDDEPPDDDGPQGPPTQDQRTLPAPGAPATPARPRPQRGRRRPRY